MKINHGLLYVLVAALLSALILGACGGGSENAALSVTPEEKAAGWRVSYDMGIKFKQSPLWRANDDNVYIHVEGDENDDKSPVYLGRYYEFFPDALNEAYENIVSDKTLNDEQIVAKLNSEVFSKTGKILAIIVIRKSHYTDDKAALAKITGFQNNEKIKEVGNFVYVFSTANADDSTFDEKGKKIYKELFDTIPEMRQSITISKPMKLDDSIGSVKKWTFSTVDLDGNAVDNSVFAKAQLTMVNAWATWCGPCRRELPDLGEVAKTYAKEKGVQIIGVVCDIDSTKKDQELITLAKSILSESHAEYLNIMINNTLIDTLLRYQQAYPTTFFVNKNGDVVGSIKVGSMDAAECKALIDEHLAILNAKK